MQVIKTIMFLTTYESNYVLKQPTHAGLSMWFMRAEITGKGPVTGNKVSHANNKTRRRFLPNLQHHRFWVESENRFVRLRLSAKGMRVIDKRGIDTVLAELRARGLKV